MGRWLVILSLAVVQCSDVAVASSNSCDVPLWKRLLSAFMPTPRPAALEQALPAKAVATPTPEEPIAESRVPEPVAKPEARQSIAGWQVHEPIAKWPAQEPVATAQVHEPVAGWQAQEPARSNGSACSSGSRRIISAFYSQGRRTASGQPFDPRGMTAAHRTLPFGTRLTVTNPRTGKSVIVVVNDRGPFVSGVSLDLTLGAAQAIGMHGTGTVCIW
jgi:peptidoglycan lytic transglycosylase